MKLFSLEEMGTGQVVRKEIQCAFNFVWKIMFSSTLLNIILFLPNKSSTSSYCPNALLKLHFWPLFWNLLLLLPLPDHCLLKLLLSRCPLTPWLPSHCPLKPRLPSRCPRKLRYPSCGPSSSGCGHRKLPVPWIMPLFLYFCYWCSRDIKANTLLSFEKDHPLHFGISILTQLLFKFFPSITNAWHFSWAPQDHGHKARFWGDQGVLVYWRGTRNVGQGCCQGFHSPLLLNQLLGWLLEVTDCSGRHRVQEPDGIFARSFYYFCCRRKTYSFKFNSHFLLRLD